MPPIDALTAALAEPATYEGAVTAAVAGVFTLLGIVLTSVVAYAKSRPKAPAADPAVVDTSPTPLAQYSGEQNEFMALVIADNADLRSTIGRLEAKFDERLAQLDAERIRFRAAVRAYLLKLSIAWAGPDRMPPPDPADLPEFGDTLPAHWLPRA